MYSILIIFVLICWSTDYGNFPENYQQIIKNYMKKFSMDSTNLIYKNWKIFGDWAIDKEKKKYIYGYSVCVDIMDKKDEKYIKRWFFIKNDILYEPVIDLKEKDIYLICTIHLPKPEFKSTARGWRDDTYFGILDKKLVKRVFFP